MSHNAERQTDHKFPNCIPEEPFEEVGEGISSWTENAGADKKLIRIATRKPARWPKPTQHTTRRVVINNESVALWRDVIRWPPKQSAGSSGGG
jgi:hypothetical protein